MTEPLHLPGTMAEPTPQIIALYNLYHLYEKGMEVHHQRHVDALATIHTALDRASQGQFRITDEPDSEFLSAVIARQAKTLSDSANCMASTACRRLDTLTAIARALGFIGKDEPLSDRARRQTEQTLATWGYQL